MPRGIPNRPRPADPETVAVLDDGPDPAALIYRDRAGAPRVHGVSEGKDNFSAVTKAAHEPEPRVEPNPKAEVAHVRR